MVWWDGQHFSALRGATVLELQGGKIRHKADYWDAETFMQQVGYLPAE